MKKLLWSLCVIAVLLSAFGLGLTAAYVTSDYSTEGTGGVTPPPLPMSWKKLYKQ